MERARELLSLKEEQSLQVSRLSFRPHTLHTGSSFYEDFALNGIRVDRVEPGLVVCTFKIPPRLADRNGKLSSGAIATLVDEVGAAVIHVDGQPMDVSVDMSVSFVSTANVDDELEITSRLLGQKGAYSATIVLLKNKASGEVVAEGRHSLFTKRTSKM